MDVRFRVETSLVVSLVIEDLRMTLFCIVVVGLRLCGVTQQAWSLHLLYYSKWAQSRQSFLKSYTFH